MQPEQVVDAPSAGQPVGEVVGQAQGVPAEAPIKETVEKAVPEKPLSRRDTILQAAKDAQAKREGARVPEGAAQAKAAPSAPVVTNAAGRKIDATTGKFIKADGTLGEQAQAPAAAPKTRQYPKTWKPELEADFHKLPPHILDQIEKREADIFKGLEDYKKQAMPAELRQVLGPREQALARQYGSVHAGLDQLFQLSDFAGRDPAGFLQWFAQQRGIQLGQPSQDGQQADPNVSALQAEIAALKHQVGSFQQQSQQASLAPYINDVERFKAEPGREKFDELRPHMAALVQSGAANTLQEAYDQAYRAKYADEWLSTQIEARQKQEAERAATARQAAVQVTGAPAPSSPQQVDPRNRRALIEAAVRNQQARG